MKWLLAAVAPLVIACGSSEAPQEVDVLAGRLQGQVVTFGGNPLVGEVISRRDYLSRTRVRTILLSTQRGSSSAPPGTMAVIASAIEIDCEALEARLLQSSDFDIEGTLVRGPSQISGPFGPDSSGEALMESVCARRADPIGHPFATLAEFVRHVDEELARSAPARALTVGAEVGDP